MVHLHRFGSRLADRHNSSGRSKYKFRHPESRHLSLALGRRNPLRYSDLRAEDDEEMEASRETVYRMAVSLETPGRGAVIGQCLAP